MKPRAYYNDNEAFVCEWLRDLIKAGLIHDGDVDNRSIRDVRPEDLRGYTQCHFFAGIGGWAYALRLAGWSDDREVWTGSCPCQPFSVAGKQKGFEDERHLWPEWYRLITECRPSIVFGEQVARAVGLGWLDTVADDLEGEGYSFGTAVLPACAVAAPHERERLWFVADTGSKRCDGREGSAGRYDADRKTAGRYESSNRFTLCGDALADADFNAWDERRIGNTEQSEGRRDANRGGKQPHILANANGGREQRRGSALQMGRLRYAREAKQDGAGFGFEWPVEPNLPRVAHGVPARVAKLRALGNAIVPQVAAEFIKAYLDVAY